MENIEIVFFRSEKKETLEEIQMSCMAILFYKSDALFTPLICINLAQCVCCSQTKHNIVYLKKQRKTANSSKSEKNTHTHTLTQYLH